MSQKVLVKLLPQADETPALPLCTGGSAPMTRTEQR